LAAAFTQALQVVLPGESLAGWHGNALPFIPFPRFVGMPGATWADYAGLAAAALGGAQVAGEASRIAWAPPNPEPADVGALAEHIESAVGSGE